VDAVSRFRAAGCETGLGKAEASSRLPFLSVGLPRKNEPGPRRRPPFQIVLLFFFLAELLASALPAELWAQASPAEGSIRGQITVTGQGQNLNLAGLAVTLTGPEPQTITRTALSDEQGLYQFSGLAAGRYRLDVTPSDFQPWTSVMELGEKQSITENISLRLNEVNEKIDVSAQSSEVSTQSSATASTFEDRQLEALPLAEQKFTAALPLVPGVVRTPDGTLNFNGQAEGQGLLLVDSTENVDPVTGRFSIPIPLESIQSMSVDSTPESASYGGFSGGLTRIETKPPFEDWKFKLHDFVPGLRGKSGRLVGVGGFTPRLQFGGPLIPNALNFSEEAEYDMKDEPVRGLPWPYNERKIRGFTSFSEFQAILSPHHVLTTTVDVFPMQKRFADINALVPQSASSDYHQHGVSVSISDAKQLNSGALLNTVLRYTRFDSDAHGQGPADMQLTPEGWGGNFFNAWARTSNSFEAMPTLQLPDHSWLGRHQVRFGIDISHRSYSGTNQSHPVDLLRQDQSLAEQLTFEGEGQLSAADTEVAEFIEDQWTLNPHLALNLGARVSSQSIGREGAIGPRVGLAYAPGNSRKTVIRSNSALVYGHVPLLAADFAQNPIRTANFFTPSGAPLGPPVVLPNVCYRSQLYSSVRDCDDGTSPRTFTWSTEVEHEFSRAFLLRFSYLDSQTRNLSVVSPVLNIVASSGALGLSDTGEARYHRFEATARVRPSERSDLNLAYVWSRSRGDLNTLSEVFVPFEEPVIRPNVSGILPADVPHRFVGWGSLPLPGKFTISPVVDVRTGLPYSQVDVFQNYVGTPNSRRFPTFFSLDVKIFREFPLRMPGMGRSDKRKIRLGVYSLNLTNHFNPDEVYNSVASPQFGQFVGNHHRVGGFVIDIVN
jgi:hypothetical protein